MSYQKKPQQFRDTAISKSGYFTFSYNAEYPVADSNARMTVSPTTYTSTPYGYRDYGVGTWSAASQANLSVTAGNTTYKITVYGPATAVGYTIGESHVEYRTLCSNVPGCS